MLPIKLLKLSINLSYVAVNDVYLRVDFTIQTFIYNAYTDLAEMFQVSVFIDSPSPYGYTEERILKEYIFK